MKVLHVTGCYLPATEWGGVVTAVSGLTAACRAAGVESEVFTTTQRSTRTLPEIVPGRRELDGTPVSWFRSIHAGGRGFVAPALWSALKRRVREFDVVHLHMLWTFPGMVGSRACLRAGVPYVVSLHGALNPHALTQRKVEKKFFLLLGERRSLERAALLHFATAAEHEAVPPWARARPSLVVPHVVEVAPLAPRAPGNDILILGRIHPIKGFDVLIPAMKQVLAAEPRARLIVAGPDEAGYRAQVEALVAAQGLREAVRFVGLLDPTERNQLLQRAVLLVAPSYQENFGMAVAEAMAAALPVVVSDKVNLAREVAAAGAGLVVPTDSGLLAEAIGALLRDPARRDRMGAAGRRLVVDRYSAQAVGEKLRQAYASIIPRA